jgi:sugar lactone lactonase YvrE
LTAFDRRDRDVTDHKGTRWVLDTNNSRVQEFTPDGTLAREWGGWGTDPGRFQFPNAIAVGPNGAIYVADTWNNRVQVFDRSPTPSTLEDA